MMATVKNPCSLAMFALLGLSMTLLSACPGSFHGGVYQDERVHYSVEGPGQGWNTLSVPQANVAWRNASLGAALLINSHCVGVEDAPLTVLTTHLLMGLSHVETESQRPLSLAGREGLETRVRATLDGVPRSLQLLVLKKDGCVYDVVLDTTPGSFEQALLGYERVKATLVVHPRRDWN